MKLQTSSNFNLEKIQTAIACCWQQNATSVVDTTSQDRFCNHYFMRDFVENGNLCFIVYILLSYISWCLLLGVSSRGDGRNAA